MKVNLTRPLPSSASLFVVVTFLIVSHWTIAIASPSSFQLVSKTFKNGATLAVAQAYMEAGGSNISPELRWSGVPAGTQSFALTVFDPDARKGVGWWHWIEVNIPVTTHELPADSGDPI